MALNVSDDLPGIGLVLPPVQLLGRDPKLDDEIAGLILRLSLAAPLPPQPIKAASSLPMVIRAPEPPCKPRFYLIVRRAGSVGPLSKNLTPVENKTNCRREAVRATRHSRRLRSRSRLFRVEEDGMDRQVELYCVLAAGYDSMALAASDQLLRNMYSRFAQLWRDAARAEVEDDLLVDLRRTSAA